MRVAFLGLGAMGYPMVLQLAAAGHMVSAWNRTARPESDLSAHGVALQEAPGAAVSGVDVVCLCVTNDSAVRSVLSQVLPVMEPGSLIIDHSTISMATAQDMAQTAALNGVHYLDAPVSGGADGAAAGTLTIMVGGNPQAFERALPVLQAIGRLIRYMGPSGSGQATKLTNQLLTAVHQAVAVEAFTFASRLGLDLESLHSVLAASYGASRMLDRTLPVIVADQYSSAFTVDLLHKDLGLIEALCRGLEVHLPLAEAALTQYQTARESGLGTLDAAALIKLLK